MRILHYVPGLDATMGGPSRSVPYQCVATLSDEFSVSMAYFANGELLAPEAADAIVQGVVNYEISTFGLFSALPRLIRMHDVLHIHGVWSPSCYWASRLALKMKRSLVITPHGTLEPWALAQKSRRKRTALWVYQRGLLEDAQIVQATSKLEATNLCNLGLRIPIAVIPHGVAVPQFSELLVGMTRPKRILFLSRIHPKKGLLQLIRAVARHKDTIESEQWTITVAGPDSDGHQAVVEAEADSLGVRRYFEFIGSIDGQQKWDLYRSSLLFILPTFSENFGLVIAEALGCGIPVITTHGAPWSELRTHGCGWWHPIGQNYLDEALGQALVTPLAALREMGGRGMMLVRERYNVSTHRDDFRSMYKWAINGGPKPSYFL